MNTNYLKVIHEHKEDSPNCYCDKCRAKIQSTTTIYTDDTETCWVYDEVTNELTEYNTCKQLNIKYN